MSPQRVERLSRPKRAPLLGYAVDNLDHHLTLARLRIADALVDLESATPADQRQDRERVSAQVHRRALCCRRRAVGGDVSLIGASLSPSGTGLDPLLLTGRGITLGSISVGSRADFEAMNRAIAMHRLHPVIDRTFPFAKAKAAYRHFEGRGHFGKVVITHD